MYADDCILFLTMLTVDPKVNPAVSNNLIQSDLNRLTAWSQDWKLNFKAEKSKEVIFHSPRINLQDYPSLQLHGNIIPTGSSHKHLGFTLDSCLTFEELLTNVIIKCNTLLNPLKALKLKLESRHLERLYFSFILPHLEYGSVIFDSAKVTPLSRLDQIHYRAALIVSGCIQGTACNKVFKCLDWMPLSQRRHEKKLLFMYM
jgi:hypothetical protein